MLAFPLLAALAVVILAVTRLLAKLAEFDALEFGGSSWFD
jgi:hypothetical protein